MHSTTVLFVLVAVVAAAYAQGFYGGGQGGFEGGPAHYHFSYGVADPYTGDFKQQHEAKEGHHVTGGYSLKEPDGTTRLVEYHAGPHSGFNAVVKRVGHAVHPIHYKSFGGQGGIGGGFGGQGGFIGGGHGVPHSHVGVTHYGYH